jgi:hypothetical protein
MWSLGKVVNTPEVCRVYLGSFWEHPMQFTENRFLLEREKQDLINELDSLPANAVIRRINELVKRCARWPPLSGCSGPYMAWWISLLTGTVCVYVSLVMCVFGGDAAGRGA